MKTHTIDYWRERLLWFTRGEASTLLRRYSCDELIVIHSGFHKIRVNDLWKLIKPSTYCVRVRPVYFYGGPTGKRYKGTLLTMVLDRLIVMQRVEGVEHVTKMVEYAQNLYQTTDLASRVENSI